VSVPFIRSRAVGRNATAPGEVAAGGDLPTGRQVELTPTLDVAAA
jgi:hypothetical protein